MKVKDTKRIMTTEAYSIKFWVKEGEFWTQKEDEFRCNSKSAHKRVEKWFFEKYRSQEVKLVSVTYQ